MDDRNAQWSKLVSLGRRQHGVVTASEVKQLGVSSTTVKRRLSSGELERLYAGVLRFAAAKNSWEQRATAALKWLGEGAALSHSSAASVYALDGFKKRVDPIELVVPMSWKAFKAPGLVIHRSRLHFPTKLICGLVVTALPRTLLDLAATVAQPRGLDDALDDAMDSAQRMYPGTDTELEYLLDRPTPGQTGSLRLGQLIAVREGRATESPLEARVVRALRLAGVPPPDSQKQFRDARGYVTRVDFYWAEKRVVLHVDGWETHHQRAQFERDRDIANRLTALGWSSVFVTSRGLSNSAWLDALRAALM